MLGSGYTVEWIGKVVRSAIKGYMRILGLEERGMTARNRAAAETATKRRFQKLCGKKSWFKLAPDGGGREEKPFRTRKPTQAQVKAKIEAVMFVPYTQGGGLKQSLTKIEENLGFQRRFKYIESGYQHGGDPDNQRSMVW